MYKEKLQDSLNKYIEMKKQFDKIISSDSYQVAASSMPFDFLKARYIIETLQLFKNADDSFMINIANGDEAIVMFKNIIDFKNTADQILNGASVLMQAFDIMEEINDFVSKDPYMSISNVLYINGYEKLKNLANDCLKEIPQYQSLKTKRFRIMFIESCINSLSKDELNKVLVAGIIKGTDLDKIRLTGSELYENNIKYLCEITGHDQFIVKTYREKLKGVTFSNDDGTDRQKYLKELKNQLDNNQIPYLKANLCEFIPPNKIPEPSIKITWNGNIIGFIPKEIAADIASSYKEPQFKVKIEGISSGDDIPYGCTVKLDVISYKFKDKTEDIELY